MQQKTKIAVAAALIFWSSAFVGIRAGLHGYSPEGMSLLRYLVASLVIGVFYLFRTKRSNLRWKDKLGLMLIGFVGIGVYNVCLNYGEITVSSGVASFIISQSPIISSVLAIIFWGEKITLLRAMGFLISLIGVAMIAYGEIGDFKLTTGLIYVITALFSGAFYSFLSKAYASKCTAIESASFVIWGGALFSALFFPHLIYDFSHASFYYTAIVIYLGIFPAALAYIAWNYTLGQLTVSQSVSFLYLLPFITTFMGWLMLNEVPSVTSLGGALIAMGGVWVVSRSYQTRSKRVADVLKVAV